MSGKPFISILVVDYLDHGVVDVVSEIPLDVCTSRSFKYGATVTDFPIESGASISDHRRVSPDEIDIEGMVSAAPLVALGNSPLGLGGDSIVQGRGAPALLLDAHDKLMDVHRKGTLVRIVDEYSVHDDMALISLDITKSKATGNVFEFKATFKQVRIAATASAALPAAVLKKLNRPKKTSDSSVAKKRAQIHRKYEEGKITAEEEKTQLAALSKAKAAKVPRP